MLAQSIVYLLTITGITIIALFTYYKRRDRSIKLFSLLSVLIAAWLLSQYLIQLNINNTGLFFAQFAILVSNFLAYSFLLFIIFFTNSDQRFKNNTWMIVTAIPIVFISMFSFSPLMLQEITITDIGFAVKAVGSMYFIQIAIAGAYLFVGLILLIINTFKKSKQDRLQNYYLLVALSQAIIITMLVNSVFASVAWTQSLIIFSLLIMIVLIAFAMVRHKLFDIKFAIVRALTYAFSVVSLAIIYAFVAFRLISPIITQWSVQQRQLVYTGLAIILALTYTPLVKFFSKVTNKIFYRDRYDVQRLINTIGQILASEIDLDVVSNKVLRELTKQITIDKAEIIVFGGKKLFYQNNVFTKNKVPITKQELKHLGRKLSLVDELAGSEKKTIMNNYGISISLPLKTSEKFIGYLLLSEKKSGEIYNDEDIRVLSIIGSELSVAIQNALSYKEIQLFNETLAQKVRERTAQLKAANEQLRQLDLAKDEFISMASHQLRTPLTTVKGYASMLEEGDFGKLSSKQQVPVHMTLDGANRMARLIDDLLNVSRMDANRFFLEITKVDIVALVQQEVEQLQTMAHNKKVKLNYSPPQETIPEIRLDDNKTRQVVMNLVDNAIHYSQPPQGGGEVSVSLQKQDDGIVFQVVDNGIGVPEKVQKKLFTKMFRANNAKDIRPDGTGLGLYLVKRVIHDEGGRIIFESKEGKGSTFGFYLPLSGVPKSIEAESKKIGAKVTAQTKS